MFSRVGLFYRVKKKPLFKDNTDSFTFQEIGAEKKKTTERISEENLNDSSLESKEDWFSPNYE